MKPTRLQSARHALVLLAIAITACGSPDGSGSTDQPPVVTISGILEGVTYQGPVTILIAIDQGAYQATLDGQPYISGSSVGAPGAHTLSVAAHVGAAAITRLVHFTIQAPAGGALIVRMFDLGVNGDGGGGDAILVTDSSAAGMVHVMIDAGPAGANANDAGYVARQLAALRVDTLAMLILTHAHGDHYGGMPSVVAGVKVKQFLYNGQVRNLASYNTLVSQARAAADTTIVVGALRDYNLGTSATPTHLKLLPPLATNLAVATDDGTLINDGSIGSHLQLGTFTMFLAGDGEVDATRTWRTQFPTLTTALSVLKVGHHGANNAVFDNGFSGTSSWLTQTSPHLALISSNGTTHPRLAALARILTQPGTTTYCTSVHGMITLRIARSGDYTVTVARNADKPCVAGTEANT